MSWLCWRTKNGELTIETDFAGRRTVTEGLTDEKRGPTNSAGFWRHPTWAGLAHRCTIFLCSWDDSLIGQLTRAGRPIYTSLQILFITGKRGGYHPIRPFGGCSWTISVKLYLEDPQQSLTDTMLANRIKNYQPQNNIFFPTMVCFLLLHNRVGLLFDNIQQCHKKVGLAPSSQLSLKCISASSLCNLERLILGSAVSACQSGNTNSATGSYFRCPGIIF